MGQQEVIWCGQIEHSMPEEGGPFSFDLTRRNAYLEKRGVKGPGFTKTGTTIAGVIFKVGQGCTLAEPCLRR